MEQDVILTEGWIGWIGLMIFYPCLATEDQDVSGSSSVSLISGVALS